MAPKAMIAVALPNTITDSGRGRFPCPITVTTTRTETKLATPESTTRLASCTLAYRHI